MGFAHDFQVDQSRAPFPSCLLDQGLEFRKTASQDAGRGYLDYFIQKELLLERSFPSGNFSEFGRGISRRNQHVLRIRTLLNKVWT